MTEHVLRVSHARLEVDSEGWDRPRRYPARLRRRLGGAAPVLMVYECRVHAQAVWADLREEHRCHLEGVRLADRQNGGASIPMT